MANSAYERKVLLNIFCLTAERRKRKKKRGNEGMPRATLATRAALPERLCTGAPAEDVDRLGRGAVACRHLKCAVGRSLT